MKEWLRVQLIEKFGGFVTVDQALDAITDSKERSKILTKAVKRLYNTIDADDILHVNQAGEWICAGKVVTNIQKKLLMAQAQQFIESDLWDILQRDVKYQANRQMFLHAKDEVQLASGKFWTFILDAFKTRLQSMSRGEGVFNSKR